MTQIHILPARTKRSPSVLDSGLQSLTGARIPTNASLSKKVVDGQLLLDLRAIASLDPFSYDPSPPTTPDLHPHPQPQLDLTAYNSLPAFAAEHPRLVRVNPRSRQSQRKSQLSATQHAASATSMPVPVPKNLIPSQATSMPSSKKQQQYYQPAQMRAALAPIVRPSTNSAHQQPLSFVGGGSDQTQSASAMDYYYPRRSHGRAPVVDDENAPYQYYGGGDLGLGGHVAGSSASSAFGAQRVSDAAESVPAAAPNPSHHRRAEREARRSIVTSSWPPSPDGLPPTPGPRFEYDAPYDADDDVDYYRRRRSSSGTADIDLEAEEDDEEDFSPANVKLSPLSSNEEEVMEEVDVGVVGDAGASYSPRDNVSVAADAASMIKQLVPSPSELLKIANEQARANAATFLSDWISEAVWEISVPLMGGHEYVLASFYDAFPVANYPVTCFRSSPGHGHLRRPSAGNVKLVAPPPFKRFAQQTIYQVSASAGSLLLALWYINRLPVRVSRMGELSELEVAFQEDLMAMPSEIPWRLLVLGLTLSNKWLEDNTFTTKTWLVSDF